jgi:hypothetical protein
LNSWDDPAGFAFGEASCRKPNRLLWVNNLLATVLRASVFQPEFSFVTAREINQQIENPDQKVDPWQTAVGIPEYSLGEIPKFTRFSVHEQIAVIAARSVFLHGHFV